MYVVSNFLGTHFGLGLLEDLVYNTQHTVLEPGSLSASTLSARSKNEWCTTSKYLIQ